MSAKDSPLKGKQKAFEVVMKVLFLHGYLTSAVHDDSGIKQLNAPNDEVRIELMTNFYDHFLKLQFGAGGIPQILEQDLANALLDFLSACTHGKLKFKMQIFNLNYHFSCIPCQSNIILSDQYLRFKREHFGLKLILSSFNVCI